MAKKMEIFSSDKMDVFYDPKTKNQIIDLKYPIYQTNFLTDAREILSKGVYRAVKFIVKKIQDDQLNLKTFINNNEGICLTIPHSEIVKWYPDKHSHRELKAAAHWLNNTTVNYETPTGWVIAKLVGEVSYDKDKGMKIYITPGVLPLYNVVESKFTLLDFSASMSIRNKAATFFYDKCCKWRNYGFFSYTPEELNELLNIDAEPNKLRSRYILTADKECKELYYEGIIDFYFDSYEVRSGQGRGGKVDLFAFRIYTSVPTSAKAQREAAEKRTYIIEAIKKAAPSLTSDDMFQQLNDLSRDELHDLYREIVRFEEDMSGNKIKDPRGILWYKLRNRYNINPNGKTRLTKNPHYEYPKYKKLSEEMKAKNPDEVQTEREMDSRTDMELPDGRTLPGWWDHWTDAINYLVQNYKVDGNDICQNDKDTLSYMLNEEDKFYPCFDDNKSELTIRIEANIYKNYVCRPCQPLFQNLHASLVESVFMYFPELKTLTYAVDQYRNGNLTLVKVKEL